MGGLSYRAIANEMSKFGKKISYTTIKRTIEKN